MLMVYWVWSHSSRQEESSRPAWLLATKQNPLIQLGRGEHLDFISVSREGKSDKLSRNLQNCAVTVSTWDYFSHARVQHNNSVVFSLHGVLG